MIMRQPALFNKLERLQSLYDELLNAVGKKFDGESRHQTALRYIKEAECSKNSVSEVKLTPIAEPKTKPAAMKAKKAKKGLPHTSVWPYPPDKTLD